MEGVSTMPSLHFAVELLNELRNSAVEPPWLRPGLCAKVRMAPDLQRCTERWCSVW
jgi:hypothetical protein